MCHVQDCCWSVQHSRTTPWPSAVIRPGSSSALTAQPSLAPHTTPLSDPLVLLWPVPVWPTPPSPHQFPPVLFIIRALGAGHCPLTHCLEAAWFFFSFTVIYLHHGKQLSSKKSYLSHRSGFIFLSITLHLFLLLLHFFLTLFLKAGAAVWEPRGWQTVAPASPRQQLFSHFSPKRMRVQAHAQQ